jgi:hypothetical protein
VLYVTQTSQTTAIRERGDVLKGVRGGRTAADARIGVILPSPAFSSPHTLTGGCAIACACRVHHRRSLGFGADSELMRGEVMGKERIAWWLRS